MFIRERRPLTERPPEAAGRVEFGHWEADTMLFGVRKQALLILRERASRLSLVLRTESKGAEPVAQAMVATLGALPLEMRRSVTFDNGTEFARHYELHAIGTETFFCDVRSPWQKGGVENAIGRLRRELPRKTDLDGGTGFPNEAQRQSKVSPWGTAISGSKSGVRLPAYSKRGPRSGKSLQVWIARHRQSLARSTATG